MDPDMNGSMMGELLGQTLVDRYFLRREIGKGGTADIYEAWDRLRGTRMAVKVLRYDNLQDSAQIEVFEREAEWLRKLEHPYIVRLYEFYRQDEIVFMVMEWVDGTNLREKIKATGRPFDLAEVARILQPVCVALNFTHQNNIYHCDIKPANILLAKDGRVLLSDFGVARFSYQREGGGTPAYMSPEQIQKRAVDARTDIYSLGVTIYEMLSGTLPFRGDSSQSHGTTPSERVAWEHVYLPLPPITRYNPSLPARVIAAIQRALNKDPVHRFSSTMDLYTEIEQASKLVPQIEQESILVTSGVTQPVREISPVKQPPTQPVGASNRQTVHLPSTNTKGSRLEGISQGVIGLVYSLDGDLINIGRSPENHIVLAERSVSRRHATIRRTRRVLLLQDEHSKAGTFLNGNPISAAVELRDGDVISFGPALSFRFYSR